MMESNEDMGCPAVSALATICAQWGDVVCEKDNTRSSKLASVWRSHLDKSLRLREAGNLATPRCSSAKVIALMKRARSCCPAIHVSTDLLGEGLTNSDNRHVSSKYLTEAPCELCLLLGPYQAQGHAVH